MTWLDYAVVGVMGVSVAWGIWRGLVREVISVAGWVLAFLAANLLGGPLGEALPASIPSPQLRVLLAFIGVFVVTLMVTTLAGLFLAKLIKSVGLEGLDRVLGSLFGVARGLLIVFVLALLAGLTALPRQPVWRESVVGTPLARTVQALKPWLPASFAARLRYD
ncbi:MAG: CvpA family protein [Burkholderiales bacterium]